MACKIKSDLVHFIYGEVSPEVNHMIKEHLPSCSECRQELDSLVNAKELLNNWKDISPSPEFQKLLNEKIKDCVKEEVGNWENIKMAFFSMLQTLSPAICGILVTTFMVLLMSGNVRAGNLNPVSLMICGVFWSGIYSMVFDLAIKNGSYEHKVCMRRLLGLNLRLSVYYTLLALIIGMGLILTSPLAKTDISYLQEFIYSFVPLFICSYLIGRKVCHNYIRHGVVQGVLYILLIGPALYMQCLNFDFSLYLLLIIISSSGALFGGIVGACASSWVFLASKNFR